MGMDSALPAFTLLQQKVVAVASSGGVREFPQEGYGCSLGSWDVGSGKSVAIQVLVNERSRCHRVVKRVHPLHALHLGVGFSFCIESLSEVLICNSAFTTISK